MPHFAEFLIYAYVCVPFAFLVKADVPSDGLRHRILTASVPLLLGWLVALYGGMAALFTLLYWGLPVGSISESNGNPVTSASMCAHFSLTTQSTLGYGNVYPKGDARWLAHLQSFLGILLNSSVIGVIVFRGLRARLNIRFPHVCCFDPIKGTFVFRFLHEGQDRILDPTIRVVLGRSPSKQEDAFITRRAYGIKLQDEAVGGAITPGLLFAFRSEPAVPLSHAPPGLKARNNVLWPSQLRPRDSLVLHVGGQLERSGDQRLETKEFALNKIECGIYEVADNNRESFDRVESTSEDYCRTACRWLARGCPLDVAVRTRSKVMPMSAG
jgi:hypothetical protein